MSVITLKDLTVKLGRAVVLEGLSCELPTGTIGLLGPNGAGKSTLIRTLLGFHRPSAGAATVLGHDVRQAARAIRSDVGYMPESDAFIAGMTAVRFVRYMAELHGLPPADAMERAHEALFWAGLGEARYRKVDTFSTGMKQRVKLAQAIVHGPRLVFLDEPTNGLDPPGRKLMVRLIQELRQEEDLSLVISSHLLRDVEACADQVLILRQGRIARVHDLRSERQGDLRFMELDLAESTPEFLEELGRLGCEHQKAAGSQLRVVVPSGVATSQLFAAAQRSGALVRTLKQRRDTLEDVFLQAMGESPLDARHVGP